MKKELFDNIFKDQKFIVELLKLKTSQDFKLKLGEKNIDVSLEDIDIILNLKQEIEDGKLDDRALELIKNFQKWIVNSELNDEDLDAVSGGINLSKKNLGRVAAFALALNSFWGNNSTVSAVLPPVELAKRYSEEKFAALSLEDQEQLVEQHKRWNEINFYQGLADGDDSLLQQARATVIVGNKATEALAKSAKSVLPFAAAVFVIKYASDILNHLKNFYATSSNALKNFFYKFNHKGIDIAIYKTTLDEIERELRSELVGQAEAIDRIKEVMTGYFESMIESKASDKKFEGGLVLYLTGAPATGKSTTMKIIEKKMGLGVCVCRMSDAIEDKGNGAVTVATRLTKPIIVDNGEVKIQKETDLTRQIKSEIPTLYCFDEVDKMRNLDSILQKRSMKNESGQIMGGSVDEMLRNFGDTGQINGVNVSGSILIATSNETPEQFRQLEGSLYNRYKGCNIQFNDFSQKDYEVLIERKSRSIKTFYKKQHNVDVVWGEHAIKYFSEKFENENSGGRGVDILMNDARYAVTKHKDSTENFKNLTVSLNYSEETGKLYAETVIK
ncbi:MAG: AAA family ATPase [Oscillospiraceae bacterium]|jgi:hypothetical protein|nr:AAA family ATPase [Oscillospiraceae bacterium]